MDRKNYILQITHAVYVFLNWCIFCALYTFRALLQMCECSLFSIADIQIPIQHSFTTNVRIFILFYCRYGAVKIISCKSRVRCTYFLVGAFFAHFTLCSLYYKCPQMCECSLFSIADIKIRSSIASSIWNMGRKNYILQLRMQCTYFLIGAFFAHFTLFALYYKCPQMCEYLSLSIADMGRKNYFLQITRALYVLFNWRIFCALYTLLAFLKMPINGRISIIFNRHYQNLA